jgi:hypothetical protein
MSFMEYSRKEAETVLDYQWALSHLDLSSCCPLSIPRLHTSHQTQISFWRQPAPTTASWHGLFLTAASARNCSPSSMQNSRLQVSAEEASARESSCGQDDPCSSDTVFLIWPSLPWFISTHALHHSLRVSSSWCMQHHMSELAKLKQ